MCGLRLACRIELLALSPFALFPTAPAAQGDEKWLNLIPALACADALTMHGKDVRARLSVTAWGRLLRMSGALGDRAISIRRNQLR